MKKYWLYAHHVVQGLVVLLLWLYGLSQYNGPPPDGGAGNSGPLAYSPWLSFLLDCLLAYVLVGFVMFCISVYRMVKRRRPDDVMATAVNTCVPVLLVLATIVVYVWLEEG